MSRRAIALLGSWLWIGGPWLALGCEPRDVTPVGRGARTFARTCAGCHGPDGRGAQRPGMPTPPRDLTRPEFQAQKTDEQLRHSIRVGKGLMPAFGGLMAEDEIANVIAFVRTLVPPGSVPAQNGSAAAPPATPGAPSAPTVAPQVPALAPTAPHSVAPQAAALTPPADLGAGVGVR
jgi:mono/diheme cytochrome c family protein